MLHLKWICLLCSIPSALNQIMQLGICPANLVHVDNLDLKKFEGRWYEIARFPQDNMFHAACSYKDLTVDQVRINVEEHFVSDQIEYVLHYNYSYDSEIGIFNPIGSTLDNLNTPLSVIDTDYQNYAIIYGCSDNEELRFKYVYLWLLSRTTTLSEEFHILCGHKINHTPFCSTAYLEMVHHTKESCDHRWTADLH